MTENMKLGDNEWVGTSWYPPLKKDNILQKLERTKGLNIFSSMSSKKQIMFINIKIDMITNVLRHYEDILSKYFWSYNIFKTPKISKLVYSKLCFSTFRALFLQKFYTYRCHLCLILFLNYVSKFCWKEFFFKFEFDF